MHTTINAAISFLYSKYGFATGRIINILTGYKYDTL